jgi:hypothetical protein
MVRPGTILRAIVFDIGVIFRALINIINEKRDRRAGRDLFPARLIDKYAGENLNRIRFLTLGRIARLTRPTTIEIGLNVSLGERNPRRATVDHAADRRPVAFAKGRDAKQMTERIE